jgi:hypothetical protein
MGMFDNLNVGDMLSRYGGAEGNPAYGNYFKKVGDLISYDMPTEMAKADQMKTDQSLNPTPSNQVGVDPTLAPGYKGPNAVGEDGLPKNVKGMLAISSILANAGSAIAGPGNPVGDAGKVVGGAANAFLANKARESTIKAIANGGMNSNFLSALLAKESMR